MDAFTQVLERSSRPGAGNSLETLVLCLLLALVLGQVIAWTYSVTHNGLSYSRTFTQSLVALTLIVNLVMLVIGDNIVTAFGLIGALAIIRFRNVLKDTRDTVFVFLSLVIGMAVGSQKYMTATVGTAVTSLVLLYLHFSSFGTLGRFDGHLSFLAPWSPSGEAGHLEVMRRFCRVWKRVSLHHVGSDGDSEYVFQVRLRDSDRSQELLDALLGVPGVRDVSLVLRDELAEV